MKNIIQTSLDRKLRLVGYQRLKSRWCKNSDEVAVIVEVQRSTYDGQHYVNIGFWINELGSYDVILPHKCHIYIRESSLPSADDENFDILLNVDLDMDEEERKKRWENFITNAMIPFCNNCLSKAGLRSAYKQGQFEHAFIHKIARKLLERKDPTANLRGDIK